MAQTWRLLLGAAPKRRERGAADAEWRGVPYAKPKGNARPRPDGKTKQRLPSRSDARRESDDPAGGGYPPQYRGGAEPTRLDLRGADPKTSPAIDLSRLQPGDEVITDRATVRMDENNIPRVTLRRGFENGRSAASLGPILVPNGPAAADVDANIAEARGRNPFWFRQMVPNRAPWDYKQSGDNGEYEAFGNFHYGATGRVVGPVGIPRGNLFQEAGRAQSRDRNSDDSFGWPGIRFLPFTGSRSFGDDPIDQYWIGQGMRYGETR
jgi:hypothetical protein